MENSVSCCKYGFRFRGGDQGGFDLVVTVTNVVANVSGVNFLLANVKQVCICVRFHKKNTTDACL